MQFLMSKPNINLDTSNCYENPQYTSESPEVTDAKDLLNKYVGLKITYKSGDKKEVIDGSTIHNWLEVDERYGRLNLMKRKLEILYIKYLVFLIHLVIQEILLQLLKKQYKLVVVIMDGLLIILKKQKI